ncbi:angiopoietin-related protein 2-like [Physella acuta]|uniref:angiopoietin-related protein 2-like n=1 Tax=Physella acuta TaxID=109671 RepID=UPI0027DBEE86|nr:angiopoietin-related protein 2-like [Physella acuta]
MSAVLFTALLVVNIMFTCGLDISLQSEYRMEGKDLFCAKLRCVENTREDNEISALVNMSVYRISELEGKIMLASISESDSKIRDNKVNGSKVDGKFLKVLGELTVSFTKPSDCFSTAFGCDVYYINRRGLIEMKENKTKPVDQHNRKPLMLMTLEAKTPENDKTIDRMSEFLKTFQDSDRLNRADLHMHLQFSTDDKRCNQSYLKTELTKENIGEAFVNLTHAMESRLNSLVSAQGSTIQRLENQMNNVVNRLNTLHKTNQELTRFKNNLTENLLKTTQQIEANIKTQEIHNKSIQKLASLYNILHKQLERLNFSVDNISFDIQTWSHKSNQSEMLTKTMQDFKKDLLNLTTEMLKNSTSILEQRQNISIQQLVESNKLMSDTQSKTLNDLQTAVSLLNNTNIDILARKEKTNNTIQHRISKPDKIGVLGSRLHGLNGSVPNESEHLKCADMNDSVLADITAAGVDVNRTLCDTKTDGGGWIIIQRRIKGDVNFTRTWNDYKKGFGSTSGDFWIGNDVISNLTDLGYNELRFDMKYKGKDYYAVYRGFKVENEAAKYKMSFTSFSGGNIRDDFIGHKFMKFTTFDSDNDILSSGNCAVDRRGGWWFRRCYDVNVNGEWASSFYDKGIHWARITSSTDSLDFVELKLRQM